MTDQRDFQVGDRVQHPEFGDGLVLETRGSGEQASVPRTDLVAKITFNEKVGRIG